MDILEINPVIFCVLLVDHAGSQLVAALHHDCREFTSCCGYILNGGSGVVMCSHSALDVPVLLPRSVARMLPVITVCFIAPVGTVLFGVFHHSVWTFWDIANSLSTLD